jgi:DNA ligase-associated metallophosphoesterase
MDQDLNHHPNRTSVKIRGEVFDLLPERCAYRRSTKTLLASDLHWGKSEIFQAHGLAIPSGVIDEDLAKLSRAIEKTGAETLLVLGDLIHSPQGVTDGVKARIQQWRADHPRLNFEMIRGNHDRAFRFPVEWGIEDRGTHVVDNPFLFTHDEPRHDVNEFVWMGHVHPVVNLSGGGDRLRLPCFVIDETTGLLPAFSAFTGGANINGRGEGRRIFAIAETSVIEV